MVAHSQGNFFTNKAYGILDPWMQPYFHMIGVASPASNVSGGGPRISFDNDPIHLPSLTTDSIANPNRAQPDLPSLDFHSFAYYMGEPVLNSEPPVSTNIAKMRIENAILAGVAAHESAQSQWKTVDGLNGCDCLTNRITVAHKFEPALDVKLQNTEVFNFNSGGKIYLVNGADYVRAVAEGESIEPVLSNDVCYLLNDENGTELGSISGSSEVSDSMPSGLFTAQLTWQQPEVRLSMRSSLMGQSVSSCGTAALGSGSKTLKSIYPGTYPINVTAQGYEALEGLDFSDEILLSVKVPDQSSNRSGFTVTNALQYPALGINGHVADILITRPKPNQPPKIELVPSLPTVGEPQDYGYSRPFRYGGGGWGLSWRGYYGGSGGGGVSGLERVISMPVTITEPKLCQPKKSCGCLPCEFHVLSYLNQAKLGPISGARMVLYKATEAHKVDKEILFEGLTSVSNKIDKAGIMLLPVPRFGELPVASEEILLMAAIADYEGDFVLELSGGLDIDRDDDLVVDAQFTPVNAKLRLILSKESLLRNDFKINILTEVAYQLSKDLLGEHYDKNRLQTRLDEIAKRVLVEKLYPDAESPLARNDLFYWVPAAHKNWLLKDYDTWLSPIVDKVYLGEDLYTDAYEYVYGEPQSDTVVLLQSQWFKVSEDAQSDTVVGQIELMSAGGSAVSHYVLRDNSGVESTLFSIDALGQVTLNAGATLDYETDKIYQFELLAVNSFGESKPVTLVVLVGNILDSIEDTGFTGGLIPENAVAGDIIGTIHFNDAGEPIERVEVGGADKTWFSVDADGSVRVTELAQLQLDYESKNTAAITVQAFNALGSSRVISLSFEISDTPEDRPIVTFLEVSLSENAQAGDEVGHVTILSSEPLTEVNLSGNGSENFSIDMDGMVRVAGSAQLDYEKRINYVLSVVAKTALSESSAGSVRIKMLNESDVPKLKRTVLRVLENSAIDTVVGSVLIDDAGLSTITQFELSGVGSEYFAINVLGEITLLNEGLNRSDNPFFDLKAVAHNTNGVSLPVFVVVYLDTQRPILGVLRTYSYENAVAGTFVGQVPLASTGADITALRIEGAGSENFNIDLLRNVTVAEGAEFDFETQTEYVLTVIATNRFGESDPVPLYIQVGDVADTIRIEGAAFSIHEDTPSGSVVGQINIVSLGGKILSHFVLSGAGSEHFSIDGLGEISTTETASFDRSVVSSYQFLVVAQDSLGFPSNEVMLGVSIADSLNNVPLLTDVTFSLMETQMTGTLIGNVNISSPVSVVEQIWIEGEGSEDFSIDTQGFIYLINPLDFLVQRRYELTIYAKNTIGLSLPVRLDIDISPEMDVTPPEIHFETSWPNVVEVPLGGQSDRGEWILDSISSRVTVTDNVDDFVENAFVVVTENGEFFDSAENSRMPFDTGAPLWIVDPSTPTVYVFTFTAIDSSGNQAQAVRTIKVVDITPPVIRLRPGENPWQGYRRSPHYRLMQGEEFIDTVSADDDSGERILVNSAIYFTPLNRAETLVSDVDTNLIGTYRIEYSAVDSSGNEAQQAVRYVVVAAPSIEKFNLNDTGILFSGNFPEGNNLDCVGDGVTGQDCATGLDTFVGFQFTKLDTNGVPLEDQTLSYDEQPWQCVLDKQTNLMWEVKDDSVEFTSLHSAKDRFTWYDSEEAIWLKETGIEDPNWDGSLRIGLALRAGDYDYRGDEDWKESLNKTCMGYDSSNPSTYCNTEAFVARVNASNAGKGLCGFSDWRLPNLNELHSIVDYGQNQTLISHDYFPNTWRLINRGERYFWSSQRYDQSQRSYFGEIKTIDFEGGTYQGVNVSNTAKSRLVRDAK